MPRIEVGTDEHYLVFELRVGAWDFGIYIVDLLIVGKNVLEVEFHFDLLAIADETSHASAVLEWNHDLWSWLRVTHLILNTSAVGHVECATSVDDGEHTFLL